MLRLGRVHFQVSPQPHDEVIDRARVGVFVQVPDLLENRLARHRPARVAHQVLQQVAFHLGELVGLLAHLQLQCFQVQRAAGERQVLVFVLVLLHPLPASQQAAQPRQQDLQLERLGQVVIGAGLEPLQHISRPAARGQHQHGNEVACRPQLLHDIKAVAARQHHVEDHRIVGGAIGQQPVKRRLAVAVHIDHMALGFKVEPQALGEVRLVFDDQDVAHFAFMRGNSSVKVAPLPSPVLSANTRPPCALAIDRTM